MIQKLRYALVLEVFFLLNAWADPISQIVVLDQKLGEVICDEETLQKAPTLGFIRPVQSKENEKQNHYLVSTPKSFTESKLISLMMGDKVNQITAEKIKSPNDKHKIANEICKASTDSKKIQEILSPESKLLIKVDLVKSKSTIERGKVEIIDSENRFAQLGPKGPFYVPGWIESYEVLQSRVENRIYRRITNLMTNQTQSIELVTPSGLIIGALYLSKDPSPKEWGTYRVWSETPIAKEAQIEAYRQMIDVEIQNALRQKNPTTDTLKKLRDLQDFYKNILQAYRLFPESSQFASYLLKSGRKSGSRQIAHESLDSLIHQYLGDGFLEQLSSAQVNGQYARLGLFKPDAKLAGIYSEFQERLLTALK